MKDALTDYMCHAHEMDKTVCDKLLEDRTREIPSVMGFDHNYIFKNGSNKDLQVAAVVTCPKKQRTMMVKTNTPGVQFYTGNFLDGSQKGCKQGAKYLRWQALCLETQHFPDSITDSDAGEMCKYDYGNCFILRPGGEEYFHVIEYHFQFGESA